MAYKGRFKPKHPEKYRGDPTNIIYRSLWEFNFMRELDSKPEVIQWSSEETIVPYRSPLDNKIHRYFPDFIYTKIVDNECKTFMVEVKPSIQTKEPKVKAKKTRRYLTEVKSYVVNKAKWDAAKLFCEKKGWVFLIKTEKGIYLYE